MKLVAPFPYVGGKRRHTKTIWGYLGDPQAYVEPFCGSAAVLLNRPASEQPRRRELINDNMGWVVNFWRATKWAPDEVAGWMDWPNTQQDQAARQQWFNENVQQDVGESLKADPDWFDAKLAGVWAWGNSNSIGRWPSGSVNQQPYTNHYQGGNQRHKNLYQWCQNLGDRLRHVQVHYGNWELCLRPSSYWAPMSKQRGGKGHTVGVYLDPPYNPAKADTSMYDHGDTWQKTAEWAFNNGDNPLYRIVLSGYQGSYETPDGWTYETLGKVGKQKRQTEGIWISPHCMKLAEPNKNRLL